MDLGPLLTAWTIRLALMLFFGVLVGRFLFGPRWGRWERPARLAWTGGCGIFLVHLACAFHFYHDWSHAAAFEHTADETARLLGVRFGWGIYANHLFTLFWITDVVWWWAIPVSHRRRPVGWTLGLYGFMLFIAFNGAVVFEDGPTRWVGGAAMMLLAGLIAWRWGDLGVDRLNSSREDPAVETYD